MIPAKRLLLGTFAATAALLSACSSSTPTTASSAFVTSVVQDLERDPNGLQTVVEFDTTVTTSLGPANFASNGDQVATDVSFTGGTQAFVTWDERVTPNDRVRVTGVESIESSFVDVTTTDNDPPTFTIVNASQTAGLGGDTVRIEFSGARVVAEDVLDIQNWSLRILGTELDLTGTQLSFDAETQTLTATLGLLANLHASFTLAANGVRSVADILVGGSNVVGSATGDSQAPTMVSAAQNLAEDEFGRVLDFTFDEAMDPVFSTSITNFSAGFPVFATEVSVPSDEVLRVTFSAPILPGFDTIELIDVVDAHGNSAGNGDVAISAGTTIVNDFDTDPEFRTVANAGGDLVEIVFEQAIAPVDALDETHWYLEVNATPIVLADQALSYDLLTKTLTVLLDDDFTTGDPFEFGAEPGNPPRDVDGQNFTETFVGTISGDTDGPTVVSVTQNRTVDPNGTTVDVAFSEDVDETLAEDESNYTIAGLTVTLATLLGSGETVRLTLDDYATPGDDTIDVATIADLAGNAMTAATAIAVVSTDGASPIPGSVAATALQGVDNDTVFVSFNDTMIEAEVEDATNWTIESPIGSALDTSLATVVYDANDNSAVLTFDGGDDINFHTGDDFQVSFAGMRDIGGNTVLAGNLTGDVDAEAALPFVESVWVETGDTSIVHVRFNEEVDFADDIFDEGTNPNGRTRYEAYTSLSVLKGIPDTVTVDADGRGAVLDFSFSVTAGSDTLSIYGVTDVTRNQMFPVLETAVAVEDAAEPALDTGVSTLVATSGEENDVATVVFDRAVSEFGLTDPANWSVTGPTVIDLTGSTFTILSSTSVQIDFDAADAGDFDFGGNYTLSVDDLFSAQGIEMTSSSDEVIAATGDSTAPAFSAVRIDAQDAQSLIVELNEAMNVTDAEDETLLDILGANPTSATRLGPRTLRATFASAPSPGDTLNFTTVRDLAANSGTIALAVAAAASSGPLPTSVAGTIVPGVGGDSVEVEFDGPVDPATALDVTNYTVTNGTVLDLSNAGLKYDSTTPHVTIHFPDDLEFDTNLTLTVDVADVANHDGIAMGSPASVGGAITGDAVAPSAVDSYVNYRADANGNVIDVRFSEALEGTVALTPGSWSTSGALVVMTVTQVNNEVFRLTLSGTYASETISITGVTDRAGNVAGNLDFDATL